MRTEKRLEGDAMDIYIRKCPECKGLLEEKHFLSKKGKEWKVKYCPECQKVVNRRLVTELPNFQ